jgi:hypothetical protein
VTNREYVRANIFLLRPGGLTIFTHVGRKTPELGSDLKPKKISEITSILFKLITADRFGTRLSLNNKENGFWRQNLMEHIKKQNYEKKVQRVS